MNKREGKLSRPGSNQPTEKRPTDTGKRKRLIVKTYGRKTYLPIDDSTSRRRND